MSDHLSLTQKWLRQNIQSYARRDLVYNHVDAVLATYSTLRPKTDIYTFDDGRSQLLLCVHGLLPIAYRRASYNIPIAVWLTLEYPAQPPLIYVVPTSDMLVKAGKFVDPSGRCEPVYILAWQKKSEGCNLKALMEALTDQFSREPPVYAKPQAKSPAPPSHDTIASTSQKPDYSSRPPPIAPGSPRSNGSVPSSPDRRPTPPPRPIPNPESPSRPPTTNSPPAPRYSHMPSQNVYHPPRPATTSTSRQDPPTYSTPPTHVQSLPYPHRHGSSVPHVSPTASPPVQAHPHPPAPLERIWQPQQRWSIPLENIPAGPHPTPVIHHRPTSIQTPAVEPPPPHVVPPARNFLEEDDDGGQPTALPPNNAPPRPPNPEVLRLHAQVHSKFTAEFTVLDQALATDAQRLRAAQSDLLAGEPALRDEMARLEAVRDVCRVVAGRFRTTVENAEANLSELRKKGDPEVDELICSTTIVYNQLINLVADDNAIEDTIYHLHRALNAGRIDLDRFLRTTRALAEEQFMKRALAEKIVASIPLGAWS